MSFALQTDAYNYPLEKVELGRMVWAADVATVASTSSIMAARAATGPCALTLVAASAATDKLTIAFPAALANTPVTAGIKVTLVANGEDTLAVTAVGSTGVLTIALAKTEATKNTATLIQAAIRDVTPSGAGEEKGKLKGIDLTGVVCTAAGDWDTAAKAPAANMANLPFAGGAGETVTPLNVLITQPSCCRVLTATVAAETVGHIAPVSVIINGTNIDGTPISETMPVFTDDTGGTVTGTKAFKTVTSIFLPSQDGVTATVAIGTSEKLGLPFMFSKAPYCFATLNGVKEATAPTVTVDADELEKNVIDLSSNLNSKEVCAYFAIPEA
jgi:hypothetical protein